MTEKVLVKNAADPEQVRNAKVKEKNQRQEELNDLACVLNTKAGRRFLWRILCHCRVFESIFQTSSQIYYNSGIQDVGHFLMAEISESNQEALFLMMRENKETNDD